MRKPGGELYGVSLEKRIESALHQSFFSKGIYQLKIIDLIKIIASDYDFNFYRRALNAVKNIAQDGSISLEKKPFGKHDLPSYIISKNKCLD
jgi:hypothetical protein